MLLYLSTAISVPKCMPNVHRAYYLAFDFAKVRKLFEINKSSELFIRKE